jgi:hypothetical protein
MKYTKDFLISELKNFYNQHNKIPSRNDFTFSPSIHYGHFERTFGSWSNAIKEAGFLTNKERLAISTASFVKKCLVCGNNIPYEQRRNSFCSQTCSGDNSNKNRSEKSREQQRNTLLKKFGLTIADVEPFKNYRTLSRFKKIHDNIKHCLLGFNNIIEGNNYDKDHRYSVVNGYKNNINPMILSHPANCEYLLKKDNCSKCGNSSVTLEQLLLEIDEWNTKYSEYNNNWYNSSMPIYINK